MSSLVTPEEQARIDRIKAAVPREIRETAIRDDNAYQCALEQAMRDHTDGRTYARDRNGRDIMVPPHQDSRFPPEVRERLRTLREATDLSFHTLRQTIEGIPDSGVNLGVDIPRGVMTFGFQAAVQIMNEGRAGCGLSISLAPGTDGQRVAAPLKLDLPFTM